MKFKRLVLNPYFLITVSAVLSALPLTFSYLFALSWVSFVPYFYTVVKCRETKVLNALWRGFLFGFIYHTFIYYWFLWFYPLDYAKLKNGSSVAVVMLAWLGISAVHGLLWCIPAACCNLVSKISKNSVLLCFTAIIGILTAEKITQFGELSFPWVRVSLGQYRATALIQSLSLFGTDGLDMIILAFNALITLVVLCKSKKRIAAICCAAALFCSNLCFGVIRLGLQVENNNELTVMTVQGSVDRSDKWAEDGIEFCYDTYSALTKENITDDVDLVIWSESAVPKVYKSKKSLKPYKDLSKSIDTPLLAGILYNKDGEHTNNAMLIERNKITATYAKRQLVPFGEYMPYEKTVSKIFPFLKNLNIMEEDYVSGNDSAIMEFGGGKIGNVICFESIYPKLTRNSVLDGAELMIETTNDSWLKNSPAINQHLAHGVFRSVENSRPLIRSANSGISAFIDSRGRIKCKLAVSEQGVLTDTVRFSNEATLYTKVGDILFPISAGVLLMWWLVCAYKFFHRKKRNKPIAAFNVIGHNG